jgi:uncharacterized membrane protein
MTTEQRIARAKHPRSIIAGPYGHPFHPVAITIPIGAWTASLVFDIVALATDESAFAAGATLLVGIGLVGAVLAATLGFMDLTQIARGTVARKTALVHMALNLTATALFAVSLIVRLAADADEPNVLAFILSVVAFLITGASGYLGGKLAYRYGIRVADEGTQSEGFQPTGR